MIEIRVIGKAHSGDINLPNQPFSLYGRLNPTYDGAQWHYTVQRFPQTSEMCFPDENYDFDAMSKDCVFLGAYDGDVCVGLAVFQEAMFKYMYLYDLKVNRTLRGQGVGAALMAKGKEIAADRGYSGIYTIGQDNNLAACLFYLKSGFVIGGLDTKVYQGTAQAEKRDILFYWDF